MQKNKLRKFIIYSVAFHIVLISAILFYFFKNPLTGGKTGTVMVGVINTNNSTQGKQPFSNKELESQTKTAEQISKPKLALEKEPAKENLEKQKNTKRQKQPTRLKASSVERKTTNNEDKVSSDKLNLKTTPHQGIESASISEKSIVGQDQASGTAGLNTELAYPDYRLNPKPKYPRTARKRGYEGEVKLKVYVLENGRVGKIEIIRPSGYEILDDSAIEAVKNWTFVPGKENGKEISSWVTVPITFQLKKG